VRLKKLLPLRMAEPAAPPRVLKICTECGKCCTYVSVGINAPNSVGNATDMLWYLYHENVSLYRDGDGEWSVVFETRCRNLKPDLLCAVYEDRPPICRDFDNTTCEVNDPEGGLEIRTPEELVAYLRERRPKIFRKIEEKYLPPHLRGGTGTRTRTRTG
jgi:Fe-S-cluster containining protein